jgi:hypothetical protein
MDGEREVRLIVGTDTLRDLAFREGNAMSGPIASCSVASASSRLLFTADVCDFFEYVINGTHVDYVCRCYLMLKLPGTTTKPNINSFLEGELGFPGGIVLNDGLAQATVSMW